MNVYPIEEIQSTPIKSEEKDAGEVPKV